MKLSITSEQWNESESHSVVSGSFRIQSMEFSRPEYWRGEPFPSPGYLPNPGIKPRSPALQADSLPAQPPGKPPGYSGKSCNNLKSFKQQANLKFCATGKSQLFKLSVTFVGKSSFPEM